MSRVTSPQVEEASKQKEYNVPCHFIFVKCTEPESLQDFEALA